MNISGFQKLTLLDYPKKIACIIFTRGCNFRCPYCHNSDLIDNSGEEEISEEEIFDYLSKRKNLIDGVVVSGGEPTLQPRLKEFIQKIKDLGLLVKLDTNGTNPKILKELIKDNLVDYVAMDIKSVFDDYEEVIGTKGNIENIKKSINILKNSQIEHEFRTTLVKNYHDLFKVEKICSYLGEKEIYYLQKFKMSEYVIDKSLQSFDNSELTLIYGTLKEKYPNLMIRGI